MIDYDYIHKVIDSCVSKRQLDTIFEWVKRLTKKDDVSSDIFSRIEARYVKISNPGLVIGNTYLAINKHDGNIVIIGKLIRLAGYGMTFATLENAFVVDDLTLYNHNLHSVELVPDLWWVMIYD
jgi:hypothetical protein